MGWNTNPQISSAINAFGGVQAATPSSNSDSFWARYWSSMGTPGATSNLGIYNSAIQRAGTEGRAISEGAGFNPEMANAGGGEHLIALRGFAA